MTRVTAGRSRDALQMSLAAARWTTARHSALQCARCLPLLFSGQSAYFLRPAGSRIGILCSLGVLPLFPLRCCHASAACRAAKMLRVEGCCCCCCCSALWMSVLSCLVVLGLTL
jgi:hypothetical protein